jgi:CIC family chloride channel protein
VIPAIIQSKRNYFPVMDKKTGVYLGIVDLNAIKAYIFDPELRHSIIVEEVMETDLPTVSLADSMIDILHKFDRSYAWSLPVISDEKFIGLVSKSRILDHYRNELKAQTED